MEDQKSAAHTKALKQFIVYWGEMASAWGINKTMGQIHALLYAESRPLDTDTIMAELTISRGNANMNIRKLEQWGLVHKVNIKGDRKDYYTAEKDVWTTAAIIIRERQQREIDPIKKNLTECLDTLAGLQPSSESEKIFHQRIEGFVAFLDLFEDFTKSMLPYVSEKNVASLRRLTKIARMKSNDQYFPPSPYNKENE
ncbi:MAG: hypothetical protein WD267_10700 [Balneolales bacterium]